MNPDIATEPAHFVPQKPKGLVFLPWLWIGLGAAFCFVLGAFIKEMAHANGPGTGGVIILLPITVAVYPIGLFWVGVGLLLLFGHRWANAAAFLASLGLLAVCLLSLALPSAIPLAAVAAVIPILTLKVILSTETRAYGEALRAVQLRRLDQIRQGLEIPAVVPILTRAWMAAGAFFLLSLPLSYLFFRIFPAGVVTDQRGFTYLVAAASIPFGAIMLLMGRDFKKPRPSAARSARILLVVGWIGLVFDALAFPSVAVISTIAFFYIASWMALGQPSFKAFGASSVTAP